MKLQRVNVAMHILPYLCSKTQATKKNLYLWCSDFDEEAAAFVGDLEHFGPWEAVDPQLVFVDHQATGADAQRDVNAIQVLCVHINSCYDKCPSLSAVCLHLQLAVTGGQTYSLSEAGDFRVREFKMLLISLFFFLKGEREFTSIL